MTDYPYAKHSKVEIIVDTQNIYYWNLNKKLMSIVQVALNFCYAENQIDFDLFL